MVANPVHPQALWGHMTLRLLRLGRSIASVRRHARPLRGWPHASARPILQRRSAVARDQRLIGFGTPLTAAFGNPSAWVMAPRGPAGKSGPSARVRRTCVPANFAWPVSRRRRCHPSALGRSRPGKGFACTIPPTDGNHHAAIGRANESPPRTGAPRLWRFAISVSADDLSVIAEHGYEGAASADQDCRSQAVSRFISDTVACLDSTG
jgi:hypothetical protein